MQITLAETNEEKLISECVKGDRKAQKAFYERFYRKLYVVALRYSKTTFEAEDILQESFVKVFNHLSEFKNDSSLDYWVKRIVVNTALKQNRKKMDKMHMDDVSEMINEPSDEPILTGYHFQELLTFIQKLAPGYQVIFNLYALEGYKHHEIAEMLGISEGTSKSQYARAKAILQRMIVKDER